MKEPLVTIVTATYNGAKYLCEAIDSVIAQDYPCKEYVIVDDASSDETAQILQEYAAQHSWIRVLRNQKNLERSRSRNKAIQAAKGKYVAFLDDDDVWTDPQKLSKQVAFLEKQPAHVLLGTQVAVIDELGDLRDDFILIRAEDSEIRKHFLKSNQFIFSTVMVKRATLLQVGGFIEDHFLAEDYELWLKL